MLQHRENIDDSSSKCTQHVLLLDSSLFPKLKHTIYTYMHKIIFFNSGKNLLTTLTDPEKCTLNIPKYTQKTTLYRIQTHTYIIGHYNPSVKIIDLVSHTTYVVCVIFCIRKRRVVQFKVDSERQIFEKLLMAIVIYSQNYCQKSAERKSPKKYFLYFVLISGLGLEPWLFV